MLGLALLNKKQSESLSGMQLFCVGMLFSVVHSAGTS